MSAVAIVALASPVVVILVAAVLGRLGTRVSRSGGDLDRMTDLAVAASLRPRTGNVAPSPVEAPIERKGNE
jgi:hypothetical protein